MAKTTGFHKYKIIYLVISFSIQNWYTVKNKTILKESLNKYVYGHLAIFKRVKYIRKLHS